MRPRLASIAFVIPITVLAAAVDYHGARKFVLGEIAPAWAAFFASLVAYQTAARWERLSAFQRSGRRATILGLDCLLATVQGAYAIYLSVLTGVMNRQQVPSGLLMGMVWAEALVHSAFAIKGLSGLGGGPRGLLLRWNACERCINCPSCTEKQGYDPVPDVPTGEEYYDIDPRPSISAEQVATGPRTGGTPSGGRGSMIHIQPEPDHANQQGPIRISQDGTVDTLKGDEEEGGKPRISEQTLVDDRE